jgi:hypothetical protein
MRLSVNSRPNRRSAGWSTPCLTLLVAFALLFPAAGTVSAAPHAIRLCSGSADWGPPSGEPLHTPGPTELISGLYLDGGPPRLRSARRCASLSGTSDAGTITVTDPASAAIVATATVASGQLAKIRLPAGIYTITGTFADAFSNNQHMQSLPRIVTIPSGQTVRQDVSVSIR